MKKNKIYRSLGDLLLVKGIIGCIINVPIIIFMNMLFSCGSSYWCDEKPTYAILRIIIFLVFAIFNISFIVMGINMRRATLDEVELDKKIGAVTTMMALTVIASVILAFFGYGLPNMIYVIAIGIMSIFGYELLDITPAIVLLFGVDLFLMVAIFVSCIGYHKQISSKKTSA